MQLIKYSLFYQNMNTKVVKSRTYIGFFKLQKSMVFDCKKYPPKANFF